MSYYLKTLQADSCLLIYGFIIALLLRVVVGGPGVSTSYLAGIVFAICLYLYSYLYGINWEYSRKIIAKGVLAGFFICLPALVYHYSNSGNFNVADGYFKWVIVTSFIAFAEEAFLRGALFDSLKKSQGVLTAILVSSLLFALLHLPLYGWHAMPLDFTVGLWLGALKAYTGTFIVPGIAHTIGDLVGWWVY